MTRLPAALSTLAALAAYAVENVSPDGNCSWFVGTGGLYEPPRDPVHPAFYCTADWWPVALGLAVLSLVLLVGSLIPRLFRNKPRQCQGRSRTDGSRLVESVRA